jgi:membrane protein YdbS with pleckstrin-like domain
MVSMIFGMGDSDNLTEAEIRRAVREEMSKAGQSVLSTVFWTILAAFTLLVGLQAVQMAFYTTGLAAVAFIAAGILVTGASIYLLYILHWA